MTETTVVICFSALQCCKLLFFPRRFLTENPKTYSCSHIQTAALQGRTLSCTNPCRRQPLDSLAPIIDVGDAPGARMAQCQRDTLYWARIFTSYEMLGAYNPRMDAVVVIARARALPTVVVGVWRIPGVSQTGRRNGKGHGLRFGG